MSIVVQTQFNDKTGNPALKKVEDYFGS